MLISSSSSGESCPCKASFHVRACGICASFTMYYDYRVALQLPETTKAHPLNVEEVGFDPNSMNNRPRRPSSSTPSCVAATTGATTTTATESRKEMGRHGDHHQCTYDVQGHKSSMCARYHSVLSSVNLCLPAR